MNSTSLVSIGLYIYNGQRFIKEALDSILNQTFTNFELIISDNASTDETAKIAEAYARRDDRIRYYRAEKNMGAGWNMRRVYELAIAKYFKWAAVDDLLEPDFLRRCVAILESDPGCVVAHAQTKEVNERGAFIKTLATPIKADSKDPVDRFRELILTDHNCYQIFGVIRMSALRQLPPHGIYVNGDRVLLARLALLGRFCEVSEPLFMNRHHSVQSVRTLPVRLISPRFRLTGRFGTLPGTEWWDPAKTRSLTFPEFRVLLEYFLSIYHAALSIGQKLRCYSLLWSWLEIHYSYMLRDIFIAADQALYIWQSRQKHP